MANTNPTPPLSPAAEHEAARVPTERHKIANPSAILRGATWLLARFPFTKSRYQNWTSGRRILVGYLLWFICLPIIPIAAMAVWYFHDPEGFKRSPWAKGLIALTLLWLGAFGFIATSPAQIDSNGKYSPIQTQPNGERASTSVVKPAAAASEEAKQNVASQKSSEASDGRKFENCTAAFKAGVFDIKRSDPAYDSALDRDSDGIACER